MNTGQHSFNSLREGRLVYSRVGFGTARSCARAKRTPRPPRCRPIPGLSGQIKTIADLERLPLTHKSDLMAVSLVQVRSVLWTGDTRDTRLNPGISRMKFCKTATRGQQPDEFCQECVCYRPFRTFRTALPPGWRRREISDMR
jgi:hypothetical protein